MESIRVVRRQDMEVGRGGVQLGVTSQNGKIVRQEPSEWPARGSQRPFPPHYLASVQLRHTLT